MLYVGIRSHEMTRFTWESVHVCEQLICIQTELYQIVNERRQAPPPPFRTPASSARRTLQIVQNCRRLRSECSLQRAVRAAGQREGVARKAHWQVVPVSQRTSYIGRLRLPPPLSSHLRAQFYHIPPASAPLSRSSAAHYLQIVHRTS